MVPLLHFKNYYELLEMIISIPLQFILNAVLLNSKDIHNEENVEGKSFPYRYT